jgi:5-methylcytosine-specific restriction endonuclease McrA
VSPRAAAKAAGLARFFDGKPCKRGHVAERRTASGECLVCRAMGVIAYRAANRDAINARDRAQRAAKPRKISARAAAKAAGLSRYLSGKPCTLGHVVERRTASGECLVCRAMGVITYRATNRVKVTASNKKWFKSNPGQQKKVNIRSRKWRSEHPEIIRAKCAARRAKRAGNGGTHTAGDIASLLKLQRGKCAHSWCLADIKSHHHVDHVLPLALGGSNDKRNIQLLCVPCNLEKGAKHPIDFANQNGMLI